MTLSRERPTVLRGEDLLRLPVATLVSSRTSGSAKANGVAGSANDDETDAIEKMQRDAYQMGLQEGRAHAEANLRAELTASVEALDRAAQAAQQAQARWNDAVPGQAIEMALELTEMLLMRELMSSADPGREALIRCLDPLSLSESVVVRLNPDDLERMGPTDELCAGRSLQLVPDSSVASGDAIADFAGGSVDAALAMALERVAVVLRS